jgi:hypothetical protein
MAEYDPQPATTFGCPDSAPPELVAAVRQQFDQMAPDLAKFFAVKADGPFANLWAAPARAREVAVLAGGKWWSGRRESNPHGQLGRLGLYH